MIQGFTVQDEDYVSEQVRGKGTGFDRIRRITGYLVGTLDRFNNGKAAEEHDRVKHSTDYAEYQTEEVMNKYTVA
jgi:hypothetical protein